MLKIATILQYGFLGSPAIFYGDERGVKGGEAPLCRVCFPWEDIDTKEEKWYKLLGKIRKSKAVKKGNFNLIFAENGVVVFERIFNDEKIVFATNMSSEPFEIEVKHAKNLLTKKDENNCMYVEPYGVAVLKIKGEKNDN